ncbi:Rid family hydrolase [Clostridium magnum]|uniref:2-aminomuconate deaminase n=1 Tax=Clostridium magnum DSM 2767 TaxID=1121326 RepID=A0A162RRW7_9CLOT|nr:Rid family hydrolase [Clostridium magnum]KZL90294.1 2-aminomuconate deaminase [Clostridium magnum DSM 2767]SHH81366.1 Enamine deaminase RidA, house cleaning of reactive enamine intermediates, YjgF/YER057c/UK114 family [Clostridium magnum DSM 2767]
MELTRTNYSSGAPLEEKTGYSRMVKVGPFIYIGGTTAVQPDGTVYGEGSAYEQTKYILEKLVNLLEKAGSKKEEVIKIKGYATDMKYAPEIAKAYSEIFHDIKPLFTVVGTHMLNRPTQLVELEVDAVIGSRVE